MTTLIRNGSHSSNPVPNIPYSPDPYHHFDRWSRGSLYGSIGCSRTDKITTIDMSLLDVLPTQPVVAWSVP